MSRSVLHQKARLPLAHFQTRTAKSLTMPPPSHYEGKRHRFHNFDDKSEEIRSIKVRNPLNYVEIRRQRFRYHQGIKRRMLVSGIGFVSTVAATIFVVYTFGDELPEQAARAKAKREREQASVEHLDAPRDASAFDGKSIVPKPGHPDIKLDAAGNELVETGTSHHPHFPRTIRLGSSTPAPEATTGALSSTGANEEYTLLGLGVRSVSFLSVQVYVMGMYVRTSDLPALQAAFVKHINPIGTSLIPGEKDQLREQLLATDDRSLELWDKVLREANVRSCFRIVPVRKTDFNHLRDGWIRGITARMQAAATTGKGAEYEDESFGEAVKEFKGLLGGQGGAPKGSEVLLTRDEHGVLGMEFEDEDQKKGRQSLGKVTDERVSRLVWLGYLGGKNVSSEGARKSIVKGVMELVERPVGTVGMAVE